MALLLIYSMKIIRKIFKTNKIKNIISINILNFILFFNIIFLNVIFLNFIFLNFIFLNFIYFIFLISLKSNIIFLKGQLIIMFYNINYHLK